MTVDEVIADLRREQATFAECAKDPDISSALRMWNTFHSRRAGDWADALEAAQRAHSAESSNG